MGYLDEEIVSLHSGIVELQRSPFARRQADIMEQLSVSIWPLLTGSRLDLMSLTGWGSPPPQYDVRTNGCHVKLNVKMMFSVFFITLDGCYLFREEKAIELYKQLKAKCKS